MGGWKTFLGTAAVGLALTGCASHQLDDHSLQFNQAAGSQSMRLLLLNAVRASKDYPLQFSKISSYRGKGLMGRAELSASLPLRQTLEGTVSPKFEFNDGISQFDLVDLSTEEAQEALKRQLNHSAFTYHTNLSGNRSSLLPQLLLLEQVVLSDRLGRVIEESVQCTCKIVDGGVCPSSTIDDEPSAPLKRLAKSATDDLIKDREFADLARKLRRTIRFVPPADLTKAKLANLRKKRSELESSLDAKEKAAFARYMKKADTYLQTRHQLTDRLKKLKESRSKFIHRLKGSNSVANEIKYACISLKTIENECPGERFPRTMDEKIVLKNDLTTECRHKIFMYGLLQSKIIGLETRRAKDEPKPDDDPKKDDDKEDKEGKESPRRTEVKGGNTFQIFAVDPKDGKGKEKTEAVAFDVLNPIFAVRCLSVGSCDIGLSASASPGIRKDEIKPVPRTPERVVRYLGELIAAQNYGEHPFQPSILDPERKGQRFTVLTVLRGHPLPGRAAVSIRDPEGVTFYIPRRSHDSNKEDLSLETLSIVTDVLNAAVSKKNFPPVASITVANP